MKIGVNPLSWSNDDLPTLGGSTPLEQCLKEGRQAGYTGFELGNKFPREPQKLRDILTAHDLVLASGWFSGGIVANTVEQEIERLKPHCELLSHCGANVLIYCDITGTIQNQQHIPLSKRVRLTEQDWPQFCSKLESVASWCQDQGLPLAYHYHMGTLVQTKEDIDRLMNECTDSVGLLLDSGHAGFAGDNPLRLVRTYGERIRHVHLKDIRQYIAQAAINRDTSFIDAVLAGVFTVPGDGDLPLDKVIRELIKKGYQGWIIVEAEQDPVIAPSVPMVTQAYTYISDILQEQ